MNFEQQPDAIDTASAKEGPEVGRIKDLAAQYRAAYDVAEDLDGQLKEAKREKAQICEALHDAMEAAGLQQVKTEHGSFSPKTEECIGILKSVEEKAFLFLEEIGLGASIKRTVNYQTLNKHYRDGDIEITDESTGLFSQWSNKKITLRRS